MSVVALLIVAWLVAAPLGSSALPGLARAIRSSAILHGVNAVMPSEARALSDGLRDSVDTNGFPDVFGGLDPDPGAQRAGARPGAGRTRGWSEPRSPRWSRCSGTAPSC